MRTINLQLATSHDDAQASGSSRPVPRQVCRLCGRSILNRQNHSVALDNPSAEQRQIINVVQSRILPHQVGFFLFLSTYCLFE